MKTGPIVILEDDKDDQELLQNVFEGIGVKNELIFFTTGEELLQFLKTTSTQPFLILSDVNTPGINGIELRRLIVQNEYLRRKSIPYIFLTTTAHPIAVSEAYEMMVQGYFVKGHSIDIIKKMLQSIIDYWTLCTHPNVNFKQS